MLPAQAGTQRTKSTRTRPSVWEKKAIPRGTFLIVLAPRQALCEGVTKMFSEEHSAERENILVTRERGGGQVNLWCDRRPAELSHKEGKPLCFVGVQPAKNKGVHLKPL